MRAGAGRRRRASAALIAAIALAGLLVGAFDIRAAGRRPTALPPTAAEIAGTMWRTILAQEPFEHFYPAGQPATISDGSGGDLTAEVGTVGPTTDGAGQLVFFWHDSRFVGWDSTVESMAVLQLQALRSGFQVTYSNYAPSDPACCPRLIPLSVRYRWTGKRIVADGLPPTVTPVPGRVHLIR